MSPPPPPSCISGVGWYVEYVGKYVSNEWIRKNVLRQSDDQIEEIQKQIADEKASGEIEDEDDLEI